VRKLIVLAIFLAVPLVGAAPTEFSFSGGWAETYVVENGQGRLGNTLNATGSENFNNIVTPFAITNAKSQGALLPTDSLLINNIWITETELAKIWIPEPDYVTQYVGGQYFNSFFDVWFDIDFVNYTDLQGSTDGNGNPVPTFVIYGHGIDQTGKYTIDIFGMGYIDESLTTGNSGPIFGNGTITVPVPGALLLVSLGAGLVGMIRRRMA
jgi:hypothetical protein